MSCPAPNWYRAALEQSRVNELQFEGFHAITHPGGTLQFPDSFAPILPGEVERADCFASHKVLYILGGDGGLAKLLRNQEAAPAVPAGTGVVVPLEEHLTFSTAGAGA